VTVFGQAIDARIAMLNALSDEDSLKFTLKGERDKIGKPKRGGKRLESCVGADVHRAFEDWVKANKPNWDHRGWAKGRNGLMQQPDAGHRKYKAVVELKPRTKSGILTGMRQTERYRQQLGKTAFPVSFSYIITSSG
jgi:hypothetical protein